MPAAGRFYRASTPAATSRMHGDRRSDDVSHRALDKCWGQGACVARTIVERTAPYDELPYSLVDQFGLRLQYVGHAEEWAAVDIEGDEDSFSAIYRRPDGGPLAALLVNRAHEIGAVRRELAAVQVAA